MANWTNPTKDDLYLDVLAAIKARDVDALTLCVSAPTNPPNGSIKYNRATNGFEEWNGAAWVPLVLSIVAGGTGGNTQAAARSALGLGNVATQNKTAVDITGGTIVGITSLSMSGSIIVGTDNLYDLGSNAKKFRYGFISSGLVVPVGTDKYVPV